MPADTPEHTVESPCVRRCCLDEQDICLGCFRTMEEICAWSGANSEDREQVLKNSEARRLKHGERWGE